LAFPDLLSYHKGHRDSNGAFVALLPENCRAKFCTRSMMAIPDI
jgi:hypothetical protein